jgi:AcrR family transcriptional regulator
MSDEVTLNKSGQALGRKGRRTRANILAGAGHLLRENPWTPLTVAAVAKQADISAPTFYLYFEDVGEVLLAMLDELQPELDAVLALLTEPWPADETYARALRFCEAYFEFWIRHVPLLRVRNNLSDQGDRRFLLSRLDGATPFSEGLAKRFSDIHRPDTDHVIEARGMAAVAMTALERLATVVAIDMYRDTTRFTWEHIPRSIAHLICESIAVRRPRG